MMLNLERSLKTIELILFLAVVSCSNPVTVEGELPAGMEFVSIPQGSFQMGAPEGEQDSSDDERPVHTVTFNYSFEMMTTEVTQGMWESVMGDNPSNFTGSSRPVETVSWYDCHEFITALNSFDPSHTYRLPSEAEWEYCCRAGTTTRFYWGDDPDAGEIGQYAWYSSNSDSETHPVATKQPNAWGLYDMSGNVREWCQDLWYSDYNGAPTDGSAWESSGAYGRVGRGGGYCYASGGCRSAYRGFSNPDDWHGSWGFRLVRSAL